MARSFQSDFLNAMRFHVTATQRTGGQDLLQPTGQALSGATAQAGFSACTMPEGSCEPVEYREGHYIYTRKYPGVPTNGGDITLSRGVARQDTAFYNWFKNVAEGNGALPEYRADVAIKQFHRVSLTTEQDTARIRQPTPITTIDITANPAKTVWVWEAFASRCKPGADFDATSSDVSVVELDLAFESFDVQEYALPT